MKVTEAFLMQPVAVRRICSIAALLVAALGVWLGIVAPLRTLALSQGHWRSGARTALARARAEAALGPAVQALVQTLPSAAVWQRLYQGQNDAAADSGLRQDLSSLLTNSGAKTDSLTMLPQLRQGPLTRHGVRISASLSIDQLRAFLTALRSHARYLRIEHLNVTAPLNQPPDTNPSLTIKADIYGFSRLGIAGHT
jgi:hypothetical protein